MENDSIRASGTNTLVDIWIGGKLRAISVSCEAIGAFLGFDESAGMTDDDRCEFVRTHLPLVVSAAKTRLLDLGPAADTVIIGEGQLGHRDKRSGERRRSDRRKGERRKASVPVADLPHPDRRRGDRRRTARRKPPKTP